jgi:hypothetical protein
MSKSHNKQPFINMLCEKLNEHDIRYKNAVDDADLLIAQVTNDKYPPQESPLLNVPYFHFFVYCHFIRFENNPFALLIDV